MCEISKLQVINIQIININKYNTFYDSTSTIAIINSEVSYNIKHPRTCFTRNVRIQCLTEIKYTITDFFLV